MESGPVLRAICVALLAVAVVATDAVGEETWRAERLPAEVYVANGEPLYARGRCFRAPPPTTGCCPDYGIAAPLFTIPCVDPFIQRQQARREDATFQLRAGAYHWWNWQRDTREWTYGYPGFEGTYFWYVQADLVWDVCWGSIDRAGFHIDFQWSENNKFRRWYRSHVWLYETYFWLEFGDWGQLKMGQVRGRFGMETDGTFFGLTAYYNGWSYDPDIMVSWENVWQGRPGFSVESYFQLLIAEDQVNGSVLGGDAESSDIYDESLGVVMRVVPTWSNDASSFALGISFLGQEIDGDGASNETAIGVEADATYTWCGFKAFAEYTRLWGTVNESHYVTGGPTDEKSVWVAGIGWTFGSITPRVAFSHGRYWNPGGFERAWLYALDINLTSWLVFTIEWVDFVGRASGGPEVQLEEGLQIVLNWNL